MKFFSRGNATRICHIILVVFFALFAKKAFAVGDSALSGDHPLNQAQAGELLLAELRCAACHSGIQRSSLPEKTAPDLAEVGTRISPEYLRKFLTSPSSAHPGTTMPDVLAARPEAERNQIAEALTHFMVAQSKTPFFAERPQPIDLEQGKTLYHTVGCVACHGPKEKLNDSQPISARDDDEEDDDPVLKAKKAMKPIAISLDHVANKYSVKSLSEFLFQPLRVRSSGRMPDMKLTPAESLALADYLVGAQPRSVEPFVLQEALVSKGKRYFQELNCAACHSLHNMAAAPLIGSLKNADFSRGCLSKTAGRSPLFQLEDSPIKAIVAALRNDPKPDTDQIAAAKSLTAFRCIACHVRDDFGGVPEAYSSYFVGSELKLGDDGRIPPPLTLIGAKLQPTWMKKVLFDGESVRHYMATRMPQYGSAIQHLPAIFARLDVLPGKTLNIPNSENRSESERNREKLLRAGGRELLGDKGLNCVACHKFNGKAAPGSQGIDLITSTQRLQPTWFNQYVRNPGVFRPRTVMPSAWPNGIATHKTILDGDTDMQIEAIWYYLSLGTSAADPSGIHGVNTKLAVENQAKTIRGRSRVAGYRGIAVGLPEKLSYAFNAETGTLSAIWQGDFINVNWSGQGSGDFNPATSDLITLAQDVSFVHLENEAAPWPLLPVMTKEAKTNPNPLYPKNLGYQFRGYFLNDSSVPTFMYRQGTMEIEDRSAAVGSQESLHLRRTLQFQSPKDQTIWFRALTGDIRQESVQIFRNDRLRLTIPKTETKLRTLQDQPKQSELLLRLQIPAGKSTLEFQYEPLKK